MLATAALFTLVSLLSFQASDPSWLNTAGGAARNACGRVGAQLAALLLTGVGIASFLSPAVFGFLAVRVHQREDRWRLLGTVVGMLVSVLSLTVFLALQWQHWTFGGSLLMTGGAFGNWAGALLQSQFNGPGASIVSASLFLVSLAVSTPLLVAKFLGRVLQGAGLFAFRVLKLVGGYVAYLGGLLAMRLAQAAGGWLKRTVDQAVAKAQAARARSAVGVAPETVQISAEVSPDDAEGEEEEEAEGDPKDSASEKPQKRAARPQPPIEIGSSKPIRASDQLPLPVIGQDRNPSSAAPKAKAAASALDSTLSSEAPNVLPELEEGSSPAKASAPAADPEILPPEPAAAVEALSRAVVGNEPTAAARAAEKLAKAAARLARKGQWKLPKVDFLRASPKIESSFDAEKLRQNAQTLTQKFADFGIEGQVTAVRPGPVITLYEFKPGPGIKVSRIASLADDLSMALSAQSVRILAPLPGKAVVGIEIPSDHRQKVFFREFLDASEFFSSEKYTIPVVMGKDIGGAPYLSDLAKMPHLLCAGQTGAGKSVFMNGLICSLLYRFTPDEMRLILVDPKFIEFRSYQDIPHLLLPVVDDAKQAATALKWAVREMERRYRILAMLNARNLAAYNQKVQEMGADVVRDLLLSEENQGEGMEKLAGGDWMEAFEHDETGAPRIGKLPYIVIIIDELADLMMIAKKDVEVSIARIAQKARAAGIHLVIATQRPSTDIITGLIKANLPSRVSFQLASQIDSRTILDKMGAERLLGQGDMLFIPPGVAQLLRLHGAYLDDGEIFKITAFLKEQGKPAYRDEILIDETEEEESMDGEDAGDEKFEEAVELARRMGSISASSLQRHMKIGYNRAARIVDQMEARGIVGPADGARPREVLMR